MTRTVTPAEYNALKAKDTELANRVGRCEGALTAAQQELVALGCTDGNVDAFIASLETEATKADEVLASQFAAYETFHANI